MPIQVRRGFVAACPVMAMLAAAAVLTSCASVGASMRNGKTRDLATRYTAAWCSHDAASVASYYSERGSLTINDGTPAVGRTAIAAAAQGFMTAFPDMVVELDGLEPQGNRVLYRWTLTGTNTGPGGTGKRVRLSGYEDWRIGSDGLIAESKGHYDAQEYDRQVQGR